MTESALVLKQGTGTRLCFVVGPIGSDGSEARKHSDLLLNAVIKPVLQDSVLNYKVKRADEDSDPGMIGDRIVEDIIRAELVVADLTDLNPNVFYELGIRHSVQKPTIHMAKAGTQLPFDNVSHRTIFVDLSDWHSQETARAKLLEFSKSIDSAGFKVTNPITQANASFQMRQSPDPRDQVLSEMRDQLNALHREIESGLRRGSFAVRRREIDQRLVVIRESLEQLLFAERPFDQSAILAELATLETRGRWKCRILDVTFNIYSIRLMVEFEDVAGAYLVEASPLPYPAH